MLRLFNTQALCSPLCLTDDNSKPLAESNVTHSTTRVLSEVSFKTAIPSCRESTAHQKKKLDFLSSPLLPAINSMQFMLWNAEIS